MARKREAARLVPAADIRGVPPDAADPTVPECCRAFSALEALAGRLSLPSLAGPQVGMAFPGFVHRVGGGYRCYLSPRFEPGGGTVAAIVRFPNAEAGRERYFLLRLHGGGRYEVRRFEWSPEPHLVAEAGDDPAFGLVVQCQAAVIAGRGPDVEGEEYFLR